jgi:hypothetical protein
MREVASESTAQSAKKQMPEASAIDVVAAWAEEHTATAGRHAFDWGCRSWSLDPIAVRTFFDNAQPTEWAEALGGGLQGRRRASHFALAMAKLSCAGGDHKEESRLGLAVAQDIQSDEPAALRDGWLTALSGVAHQCRACAPPLQEELALALLDLSFRALADLDIRFAQTGNIAPSKKHELDSVVAFLAAAEDVLGYPHSELTQDLARRQRARKVNKKAGPQKPFFNKHRNALVDTWAKHREAWFRARYEMKFEQAPPEPFMLRSDSTPSGWQMLPEVRRAFNPEDHRAFRRDMEAMYRRDQNLPAKGEGWVSQTHLANCVAEALPHLEVLREASPPWLGRQRLDVFVPALNLAIEYQGEQHYLPLDHWGGEQGLQDRRIMDDAKRKACANASVTLIEWNYNTPITLEAVKARLASVL